MRMMGTYARVQIAFIAIGIAGMSGIGGATFAHTHDMKATTIALLASAVGLALLGRRALRYWWVEVMLGLDNPYSETTERWEVWESAPAYAHGCGQQHAGNVPSGED